ncbi:MAG TPA: type II toxin-antitoxin system RelE/ParE family toxin [Gaiellaceae bacterium]|nr:type II toxin-antitoxin system RelE/ParE family toxin [Gaiellaceae bacterium]
MRERLGLAIDAFAANPRLVGCVRLAGRDDYRIRIGDYRVVYAVDDDKRLVIVARIARRREVCRR